jgi:uncharacterized membrane protein
MSDTRDLTTAARRWFNLAPEMLNEHQRRVLKRAKARQPIALDTNAGFSQTLTFGQRLADRVASIGGSWVFIIGFGVVLAFWVGLNGLLAAKAFDPYPFIFLNLLLSMLAAIQAPVIMMSQNRQASKDRLDAAHDYEVNLKAEIEIIALHDKLDQLRSQDMESLIRKQEEQLAMLTRLLEAAPVADRPPSA